jgi:glycine oxidase
MASTARIVVIGAGVVGGAIAHELARRAASVTILDRRGIGLGATQASAGILAPFIEADHGPLLELTARSLALFDEFIAQLTRDSDIVIPYRRTGTLQVAGDPEQLNALSAAAVKLDAHGVRSTLLDVRETLREEPHLAGDIAGGLLVPAHGFVGAAQLTRALMTAACRRGATFHDAHCARRISRTATGVAVDTDRGQIIADAAVLAAGSWSGALEVDGTRARIPVRPIRGQLLHLGWNGPSFSRVTWSDRCYVVPWDDGTLLVGATVEDAGFVERTTVAGVRDLLDAVCELAPHAWTAGVLAIKAGLRPATPDELPAIGASRVIPNLMYATGHYRNGVLLAPLTAALVADALLDGRVDPVLAATAPQRFGEV